MIETLYADDFKSIITQLHSDCCGSSRLVVQVSPLGRLNLYCPECQKLCWRLALKSGLTVTGRTPTKPEVQDLGKRAYKRSTEEVLPVDFAKIELRIFASRIQETCEQLRPFIADDEQRKEVAIKIVGQLLGLRRRDEGE